MRRMIGHIALLTVLGLVAAGCFGDDDSSATTGDSTASDSGDATGGDSGDEDPGTVAGDDGVDDCGQGQAWPDDPDFREAVCRPYMAMLDLIGGDASGIPAWNERITAAILGYDDDRAGSIAELNAVTAEIQAAVG